MANEDALQMALELCPIIFFLSQSEQTAFLLSFLKISQIFFRGFFGAPLFTITRGPPGVLTPIIFSKLGNFFRAKIYFVFFFFFLFLKKTQF